MKFKIGIIGIVLGIAILIGVFGFQDDQVERDERLVFHVTLASPEKYENGVFTDSFQIDEGIYEINFVPNGDSPEMMSIILKSESFKITKKFALVGTPHETGVSTYFTWDYTGNKNIQIPQQEQVEIIIDPNGDLLGPVSVDIIRK